MSDKSEGRPAGRAARAVTAGLTWLFLAVLAIGAITVLSWLPNDTQADGHSELPALRLNSPVVTWTVSDEDIYLSGQDTARWGWPKELAPENRRAIIWMTQDVLADPNGWAQAGLRFKETSGKARISFKWVTPGQLQAACSGSGSPKEELLGCASPGVQSCTVYLGINVVLSDSTGVIERMFPNVLNHEVGHCLGFEHTSKGLMAPELNGIQYPSAALLGKVRQQLEPPHRRSWWSRHWQEFLLMSLLGTAVWWTAFFIGTIKQRVDDGLISARQINEVLEAFGPGCNAASEPAIPG